MHEFATTNCKIVWIKKPPSPTHNATMEFSQHQSNEDGDEAKESEAHFSAYSHFRLRIAIVCWLWEKNCKNETQFLYTLVQWDAIELLYHKVVE